MAVKSESFPAKPEVRAWQANFLLYAQSLAVVLVSIENRCNFITYQYLFCLMTFMAIQISSMLSADMITVCLLSAKKLQCLANTKINFAA